jgi:hypothetical protein
MLTSPLWIGGEIFLGFSLTIFVGAVIAVFGNQIRTGRHKPTGAVRLPSTRAFPLPSPDPLQLGNPRRIVGRAPLLKLAQPVAAAFPLNTEQGAHVTRKGLARTAITRRAA